MAENVYTGHGIGCEGVDWIDLTGQGHVACCCEHDNEHLDAIKCVEFFD